VGTCTIQATQAGNATYAPATPVNQSFPVTPASETITFPPLSNRPYGSAPFTVSATASSGLTVSFNSQTAPVCTVSGSTVTLVAAGACTVQATQAGNATFASATPVNQSFTVTQASQTVSFGIGTQQTLTYGGTVNVSATASSGLPVSYNSQTPSICTVSGATVTATGVSTCTIQATQQGNGNYSAATPANQSFTVTQASQTISFPIMIQVGIPYGSTATLGAIASSGLPVSYTSQTLSVCTVSGATVTVVNVGNGTCTIQATQAGNADYTAAAPVNVSLLASPAGQTITFGTLPDRALGTAPFLLSATASSGLPVSFSSPPFSCTISGATVTLTSVGTCTVYATQSGNMNYSAAPMVSQSFSVTASAVTVSVTPTSASLYASQTQPFTATVTGSANTSVTWSVNPSVGSIDSTGLYTAPGTIASQQSVTVTATSVADTTKTASATVTLNPAVSVSVTPSTASLVASQPQQFTAAVTGSSNTSVTWSLSPNAGSISNSGLYTAPSTIASQQTVTVTATSVADTTKTASATVTLTPVTVSVTPTTASLGVSQTQQFTAAVTGSSNMSVTWSLSPNAGSISNSGLYTAPSTIASQQTVTVTATSAADVTKTASATVTLTPVTVGVTPSTASLGVSQTQQFTAAVTGSSNTSVTWSLNPVVGTIDGTGLYIAPSTIASQQTVTVTATSAADTTKSSSATVTLTPASTTSAMQSARSGQTATRLAIGQVLVAGGKNNSGVLGSSELYNQSNQTFTASGTMATQRWMHSATLLYDGTVLVAGGSNSLAGATLNTAEIYNPSTGTFSLLPNALNTARAGHTATLLNNGQVLLVGGIDPTAGILSDAELYDPPTQTFIDLGDTNDPRYRHTATLLQNGQVLIAGGETDPAPLGAYNSAELFDPVAQTFTALLVPMTSGREGHAAVLLNNGQVLIAGGDNAGPTSANTAELFNPTLAIFTPVTAPMAAARFSPTATLLNGGSVLIAGGATDSGGSSTVLSSGEVFNPSTQIFTSVGGMTSAREYQTASLLNDGTVLFAGGTSGTAILNSAELYMASQLSGLVSIAVTPATSTIGAGAQQSFTATGTFSNGSVQQLASVLWSSSSTSVAPVSGDSTNSGTAQTTAQGTATVRASAPGVSGTATLTVTAPTLVSFAVSPQNTAIPLATTQQFAATGTYTDGSTQDLTASAAWTSTATAVAPIANSGLATGLALGSATIQAAYGTWSASTGATVVGPALVSFSITPGTATIASGTSQQYHATGTFSDGSTQDVTAWVTWSSGTATVATVTTAGLVTALAQGTSTISAVYGSITVSAALTVGPPTLVSLAITPNFVVLSSGGSQQLTATGTFTDGSAQNISASSVWASSNTAMVAVNSGGLATAVGAGTATITARSGSASATASLLVPSGTQTGLITSRYQHSATVLPNGQILIAGGITCLTATSCTYLNSAEIYSPATDTFASTGAMATARSAPAVLLNSGKVLVAGGYTCNSSGACTSLGSAEIYDPVAATFSGAGTMTASRSGQTMTLLNNGTVLIAGGETCTSATSCTALSTAEIYDPVAGTFTVTLSNMSAARFGASAVALPGYASGVVLIVGGFDGTNLPAAAEVYNPADGTFGWTGSRLSVPRFAATATLLSDGTVLVAGGSTCALPGCPTNAAEIYDPVQDKFSLMTGGMTAARFDHTATLTVTGKVYIAGGFTSCASTCTSAASTEVFDPVAGTFTAASSVASALAGQTASLVGNGNLLLIGGIRSGVTVASDAWVPSGLVSIAVTPATQELILGQTQPFVATGAFNDGSTQTLQSVIWSSSNSAVASVSNVPGSAGTATALAAGVSTLTATVGDVSGSAALKVATLVSIAISSAVVSVGSSQQLTATGALSDGTVENLTAVATWTSSNFNTVAVASNGAAFGISAGTANVMASVGGLSATISVTVQGPPPPPSINSVSPQSGAANTLVTITGSGFGAALGNGQVWLGSTIGAVMSWSDTRITATVSSIAVTGSVMVQQGGAASNAVPFTVSTATISGLSSSLGAPGAQITITGTYFGTTQGQVIIGNASGVVVSWSPTQVVAAVSSASTPGPGKVEILAGDVMSNAVSFTVDSLQITGISPASGPVGTVVTVTGYGFGASQGNSTVSIGGAEGQVQRWSDNTVVVKVMGVTSGAAYIVQDGVQSNSVQFTAAGGLTLVPNSITMRRGSISPIQALNGSSQPVTGLTWTSSNPTIVSLSTDDPPVLTALQPGNVTITASTAGGAVTASAAVQVVADLPANAVLCSNPGNGSGTYSLVPAVPSPTGVAGIFAFQNDGTVAAITSSCITAWTADVSDTYSGGRVLPDFQGGLAVVGATGGVWSVRKLDGITGQAYPAYSPAAPPSGEASLGANGGQLVAVHPDGTIFAIQGNSDPASNTAWDQVIGVDPRTGTQKFAITLDDWGGFVWGVIIAGDGYAYVAYSDREFDPTPSSHLEYDQLKLIRVSSSGAYHKFPDIYDWAGSSEDITDPQVTMITNADQGLLIAWGAGEGGMAITTGTSVSNVSASQVGGVVPILQAQDGSFIGTSTTVGQNGSGFTNNIVSFDKTGKVRWVVANDQPQTATVYYTPTVSLGVIGTSGTQYSQTGKNLGKVVGGTPTQTWTGSRYQISPAQTLQKIAGPPIAQATPPFWSDAQANQSGNSTSPLCHDSRDQIVAEYGTYPIRDYGFQDGINGAVKTNAFPPFTPNCFLLANSSNYPGFNFTGARIPWILVKEPLAVPASYGYGLNSWQQRITQAGVPGPRAIDSVYRDPIHQQVINKGAPNSRHQFGDAVDLNAQKNGQDDQATWNKMIKAARDAGADFVEPQNLPCHLVCAHADWRYTSPGKYVH